MPLRLPVALPLLDRSPLRAPGLGLLAAGAGALAAGRAWGDLVLALAGSVFLAALALLGGCSLLRGILLRRRLRSALREAPREIRGEEGRPLPTGLRAACPRVPLAHAGWVAWDHPPGRSRLEGGHRVTEILVPADRALADGQRGRVVVEDLLGAFRWSLPLATGRRIQVLPPRAEIPVEMLLRALASGDLLSHPEGPREGDRVDSRPYAPGDPARLVLWKAWARRRELLVRDPESALDPRDRSLLVCLVAGPGDGGAAAVARLLAEELVPAGKARLAADGSPEEVDDLPAALAAISRSAGARDRPGEVLRLAAGAARRGETVLVVCPAWPPPPADRLHAAAGANGELAVLAVGHSHPDPGPRGLPERWLLRTPAAGPARPAIASRLAPLAGGGLRTVLVDLATGEVAPLEGKPA